MGKPEAYVENYLRNKSREKGYLCYKFVSPGHAGVPDRVLIGNRHVLFVELKSDKGRLSKLQAYRIDEMRRAGADVRVINSRDKVDELLEEMEHG